MYKVLDNFLAPEVLSLIKDVMYNENFAWYAHDYVASKAHDSADDSFYFTHNFYLDEKVNSNHFDTMIVPICFMLLGEEVPLLRAKANLFTKRDKQIKYGLHTDYSYEKHTTLVYSLNTNNGYTEFEDGTTIPSIENQLLIFDGNIPHRSVGQTDEKFRINFNINLKTDPADLCKN